MCKECEVKTIQATAKLLDRGQGMFSLIAKLLHVSAINEGDNQEEWISTLLDAAPDDTRAALKMIEYIKLGLDRVEIGLMVNRMLNEGMELELVPLDQPPNNPHLS